MPFPFSAGEIVTATNLNAALGLVPIATNVTGSSTTFTVSSSIPSSYQSLLVVGTLAHDNASAAGAVRDVGFTINNDTSAGYDSVIAWWGSGTTTSTVENGTNGRIAQVSTNASTFAAWIPNHDTGSINRQVLSQFSIMSTAASSMRVGQVASRSPVTAAMTRLDLTLISGGGDAFTSNTVVSLYGVS